MSTKINFTHAKLKSITPPQDKRFEHYRDTKEVGLELRVSNTGIMTFALRKRFGNKSRFTIGRFPDLTVDIARKIAMEYKGKIARGTDPKEEKIALSQDDITFGYMFENYIERHAKNNIRSWKDDVREVPRFYKHMFNKKSSGVTKQQLQAIHEDIGKNNGTYHANRMLDRIRSIFNKNIEWGWNHPNPCVGIKKFKEKSRDRFLQPEELKRFFESVDQEESQINKDCIHILLLTGARKSNVFEMAWKDISFISKTWRIPETKNGEPVNVPLTAQAIEILKKRKGESDSPFVFPGNGRTGHIADIKKAWKRIIDRAGIENLRIHDLRRSRGSWMAITGATTAVIGKTLGHKSREATAIYERLNIDPVRDAMEKADEAIMKFANIK